MFAALKLLAFDEYETAKENPGYEHYRKYPLKYLKIIS